MNYGVNAADNQGWSVNATNNWWGYGSGPYHPVNNTGGEGDEITDDVEFDPWLLKSPIPPPTAHIDSVSPDVARYGQEILFTGHGTTEGFIHSYVWHSSIDGELHNGTDTSFSLTSLSLGSHTISFKAQDNYGSWSEEASTTLTVMANKKPTVTVTSHKNGSKVSGTVTVSGTASDPDGTVVRVELALDVQAEWEVATGTDSWSHTRDTKEYGAGEHTLYVRAYDGEDYSDVVSYDFTVEEGDEAGFLPGFEMVVLVGVFGVVWYVKRKRN